MLIASILLIGLLSYSSLGIAHNPSDMDLVYDESTSTLTVIITHEVENKTIHYINGVKICLQESTVKTINYTSQPTNETFHYQYTITAVKGDKIKVAAYCTNGGEIHEDFVVGAVQSSLDIPGFNKLGLIFMLSVTLLIWSTVNKIKKKRSM